MKSFLFALVCLGVGQFALAQSVPVPKITGSCPYRTVASGGACVPNGNTQIFLKGDGPCPQGWTTSMRVYCVR